MSFTQVSFLFVFFPASVLIYLAAYKMSNRNAGICNGIIIAESILFIAWADFRLAGFFASFVVLTYLAGKAVYKSQQERRKSESELWLYLITALMVMMMAIYRYMPSLSIENDGEAVTMPLFTNIVVPMGIAFLGLESLSYILDIYKGLEEPGSISDVSVFLLFFPKIACGPIMLWRDFRPQLKDRKVTINSISEGLGRIVLGLAKKAIIADTFAMQIALIDSHAVATGTDAPTMWLRALLYFFRIYYDFSGYSDIAVGLAEIFGFDIYENFDCPYLSSSLTEFWRSWHMSLGRWIREYVYIPLGGNRSGSMELNVLATFVIAAMWHGWKVNIILWGVLNALVVIAEKKYGKGAAHSRFTPQARTVITVFLVAFGWILFSAGDLVNAGELFKSMFVSTSTTTVPNFTWRFYMTDRITAFLIVAALGAFGVIAKLGNMVKKIMPETAAFILTKLITIALFAADIMFLLGDYTGQPFIYSAFPF